MRPENSIIVSIIIPVYNVSRYIERCLKSVIRQSYNHFECILVDDASPDDSLSRCERLIAAYEGPICFRVLRHEMNRGLSAARNTGTKAAVGDYILYIDSDDWISDDCVEKLITPVLNDRSIEMVLGECLRVSDDGPIKNQNNCWRPEADIVSHEEVRRIFFDDNWHFIPAAWNKLTSREFIIQHQLWFEEGLLLEDRLWTFFTVKHLSHLYTIPDVTYFYYYRSDSIINGTDKRVKARHVSAVCSIISKNLTPGEEAKEAVLYSLSFSRFYMHQPKSVENKATARRFARALPFRKYPMEKTVLCMTRILPHNNGGRSIYKALYNFLLRMRTRQSHPEPRRRSIC